MYLPYQFDYILAIGIIFASLDAYNIGANDVANSFATSVASRALKLWQAIILAAIAEFLGSVLVGARVTSSIKNNIIDVDAFADDPYVLMLVMAMALIGSSVWLMTATIAGLPVSTTHSIIGAITGAGIATLGWNGPNWGWNGGKGIAGIIASWFIAPLIAGGFSAIIFLVTKYLVLIRKKPLRAGLIATPIYFGVTLGILTMVIISKGAPSLNLKKLSTGVIIGAVFGVVGVTMALVVIFILPYFYRKLVLEDWRIKWYHIFYGPLLLRWGPVPVLSDNVQPRTVVEYFAVEKDEANMSPPTTEPQDGRNGDDENQTTNKMKNEQISEQSNGQIHPISPQEVPLEQAERTRSVILLKLWLFAKRTIFHGLFVDVLGDQERVGDGRFDRYLSRGIKEVHKRAHRFDNSTEHLFALLQILTAVTASFAHGSNDVSNAAAPLTVIYQVWSTGMIDNNLGVPVWVLAFMGGMIVIGLWTYGYNVMRNLGNRITKHTPSRGFSISLGAAVTVILASYLGIPVSTTQCVVGSTLAVGLCNGTLGAVNWVTIAWCYLGWLITLPIAAIISGVLTAIIVNAPQFGHSGTQT